MKNLTLLVLVFFVILDSALLQKTVELVKRNKN